MSSLDYIRSHIETNEGFVAKVAFDDKIVDPFVEMVNPPEAVVTAQAPGLGSTACLDADEIMQRRADDFEMMRFVARQLVRYPEYVAIMEQFFIDASNEL